MRSASSNSSLYSSTFHTLILTRSNFKDTLFLFRRLSTSFAYYGLAMDLQKFGVDFYLIQVIFGAVDIPAKVVITLTMSFIGRRPSQSGALILAGITILINLMVPYGMSEHMVCLQAAEH